MTHLFPYRWEIKDGYPSKQIQFHGKKVFGTFICGGGSSMGYKLAGYNHLGGVEIDKSLCKMYQTNHNPKYIYNDDVRNFLDRSDLPDELFDLDILDGSPPCSSFSMAGNREKDWGKEKAFREGQSMQRLDDLFFDYIDIANKLKPKVIIAENVKGLISGNAKSYVKKIKKRFEESGYIVQLFLLNAATMGVPQRRERVFFICRNKNLGLDDIKLKFNEKTIKYKEFEHTTGEEPDLTNDQEHWWSMCRPGNSFSSIHPKKHWFNAYKLSLEDVSPTLTASGGNAAPFHPTLPRKINKAEYCCIGTFPQDYDFGDQKHQYIIGMSVPPVMMAQISNQIYLQWLSKM